MATPPAESTESTEADNSVEPALSMLMATPPADAINDSTEAGNSIKYAVNRACLPAVATSELTDSSVMASVSSN